jgi:uncharacterized membrane protein
MKNMIDRYLYAVSRRLPENIREDVQRELRSNIEDMLPENPSEEDIERVLAELGSPSKLAVKYHPNPRYLISPELFDDYMMVLKIVAVTLSTLLAAISVLTFVFGDVGGVSAVEFTTAVVTSILTSVFSGVVQAFFWVTVVFFLMERLNGKSIIKPWSPKDLPEIPTDTKGVIKPGEVIAGAIFSVIFSVIFLAGALRHPPLFAWYEAGASTVPLFTESVVRQFLPLFILVVLLNLLAAAAKLVRGRWTYGVAGLHILYEVVSAAVSMAFLTRPNVFTGEFLARFAGKVNIAEPALRGHIHTGIIVILVLTVIGTLAESITALVRASRNSK